MDTRLMKLIVGAAVYNLARVTVIKLKGENDSVIENPEFVPITSTTEFGIKSDSTEQGGNWTTIIQFSNVDYMY